MDGAGPWQTIRYVILPELRWPLLFVTTYQTLSLLTSFEQILLLTDGQFGTEVWSLWAYHRALSNYFGNFQWGFGAALAMVFLLSVLATGTGFGLGPAQPEPGQPDGIGQPRHDVPGAAVESGGPDLHEHLVVVE